MPGHSELSHGAPSDLPLVSHPQKDSYVLGPNPHSFRRRTTYFACYSARFTQPPTHQFWGPTSCIFVFIVIIFVVIVVAIIFTTALDRHQMGTNRKWGMDLQMADWSIVFLLKQSLFGELQMLRCPKWFCNLCM